MCGLFGIYSTEFLTDDEKSLFMTLGVLSTPRGKDATGILAVENSKVKPKDNPDGEPIVYYAVLKDVTEPYIFFKDLKNSNTIKSQNNCLMGHNRHATIGGKSQETAHPFHHENIIGVHNGTIRGYALESQYLSDSDKLYSRFNEIGVHAALTELPEDSAYALVWWNMEENSFNFFHNDQRPFHYALSNDGKRIIWASEGRMIDAAISYHEMGASYKETVALKTNNLVSFTTNKNIDSKQFGLIRWAVFDNYLDAEVIKKHEYKSVSYYSSSAGYWSNGKWISFGRDYSGYDSKLADDQDKFWEAYETARANGSTKPAADAEAALKAEEAKGKEAEAEAEADAETKPSTPITGPVEGEVRSSSSDTFQYKGVHVWDQVSKKDVTYTYWPIQRKISKRKAPTLYKDMPSYTDFKPFETDYDEELENCQRYIHNANDGVFITVSEEDYTLSIHMPSGRIKTISVDNPRWNGWYILRDKMLVEWSEGTEDARLKGVSSFTIRFYPWNVAHSFASVNSGVYNDEGLSEDKVPVTSSLVAFDNKEKPEAKEAAKANDTRSKTPIKKGGALEKGPIEVSDLEDLPWDNNIVAYYEGYNREKLDVNEALDLLSKCCANCFEYNGIEDKVYWFNKVEYLCEPCADLPVIQQHIDIRSTYLGKLKEA